MIPLPHLIGFFSILNIFFDHDREIAELRCLQKELNENIERINHSTYSNEKKEEYIEDYKKKYDLPFIRQGIFTNFLKSTFVMLLAFGGT